ncbi:hypothetical protein P4S95_21285 [Aneurinibacillus aneurinilyticus]|uniref:hypothetical protein n=1 Tax=Aneurinibacillus aneurinilyticus TaxID=1391 RepID=UPI002E24E074|nr:hypothetical protein [Aneurinibacillus aneurinilyticus]
MIIYKVEERRCTRRRVPSSFSHKEETQPLCGPAWLGAKSGLLRFRAGDEPTPVWGAIW